MRKDNSAKNIRYDYPQCGGYEVKVAPDRAGILRAIITHYSNYQGRRTGDKYKMIIGSHSYYMAEYIGWALGLESPDDDSYSAANAILSDIERGAINFDNLQIINRGQKVV